MDDKILFGYLSLFFVMVAGAPYLYSVLTGKTKPHIFTWVIWALVTGIAAAAQYAGHAGPGAWAAISSAVFCAAIAVLAFKYGEPTIKRSDWVAFGLGLGAIPLWYYTANPLTGSVVATFIDVLAYYPTFRKSYVKPHEEMILLYVVNNAKHLASLFAMTAYSATTLLYPGVLFFANMALILMLAWRRAQLKSGTALH